MRVDKNLSDAKDVAEVVPWELQNGKVLADSIDWYASGHVTEPDAAQGSCGACWAFAASSLLESLSAIKLQKPAERYSIAQLIDCDDINDGCEGGWMYDAFEYTSKHGILKQEDYSHLYKQWKSPSCDADDSRAVFRNSG